MPATEFDEKMALLLVDDDNYDDLSDFNEDGTLIDNNEYVPNDEDVLLSDTAVHIKCR